MEKKVSVIIPARNEEKFIKKTIESLKKTAICPVEIIAVVNGSRDRTYEISQGCADKVLNFSTALGPSAARNEGAKIATGDIFVFLDADTEVSDNAVMEIVNNSGFSDIGVCSAAVAKEETDKRLRAKIFFAFKNFIHKTKIYKGSIALIFCSKDIFFKIGGFNENMQVGELNDFIKKAVENGASYKFLNSCYITTSLRRYEKKGYLRTFLFWAKWKILSAFKKEKKMAEKYFK